MSQPPLEVPGSNPAPYPDGDPPKYTEAFPTATAYPPAGPPQDQPTPAYPPTGPPQDQPTPAYPPAGPPYGQPTPAYTPAGHPQGQPMPGSMPVSGPQPLTTVNYTASTQQMTYVRATPFSEFPVQMTCPNCQESITTRTAYVNGLLLWLVVGTICIFGGFLGCCLIPFCISGCKDVAHTCPKCNVYVGTFKRM